MNAVNVHEAKTNLSKLLRRVVAGEEITITKRGVPIARLIPVSRKAARRELGFEKGRARIASDFDAPLPPEILARSLGKTSKRKSR